MLKLTSAIWDAPISLAVEAVCSLN